MKYLYMIGGTMGVGKTTTCQLLKKQLNNCVFLDGDWCWDAHPFQVTEETRAMVLGNICHLLNSFIACSAYENIVFCWVMHQQKILDDILSRLHLQNVRVLPISLICDETSLRARLQKDVDAGIREADILDRSAARLPLYNSLSTIKIDVSHLTVSEAAQKILSLKEAL